MIQHANRHRAGITLTEILISILIMGVGMVSLATLFPLGLLRMRDAQRSSRSSYLSGAAAADLEARNLLDKSSFGRALRASSGGVLYFSPWNNISPYTTAPYDPWVHDTVFPGTNPSGGVSRSGGPGLPVAYDPLWRYLTGVYLGDQRTEARFGSGIGFLLTDPDGGQPSAWGLQRLTNFNPQLIAGFPGSPIYAFGPNVVPDTFVSPEDLVLQSDVGTQSVNNLSPVVPDLSLSKDQNGQPIVTADWRFSWMFTGQQSDSLNGTVFDGDVVIWENRQFGLSQLPGVSGSQYVVDGETVVEGVFGFGRVFPTGTGGTGFASTADRSVLLRWPTTTPDPDVKVGSWIADVTYERNANVETARFGFPDYPYQRCYWYQIVKRTNPAIQAFPSDGNTTMRAMTVWVSTPLKAQTIRSTGTGAPVHRNAALIAPNVVNVFPRVIYTR